MDNHLIINASYRVGMTGFEPATSRLPDDYYKSHYNLDNQLNAYLPFSLGLIHGLNRINRGGLTIFYLIIQCISYSFLPFFPKSNLRVNEI